MSDQVLTYAVPENDRRIVYTAVDGQTVFDADYPFLEADSVRVFKNGARLYHDVDYSADPAQGRVALFSEAQGGDKVVLEGKHPIRRAKSYPRRAGLDSALLNDDMRKIIYVLQELRRDVDRLVGLNPAQTGQVDAALPVLEAGKSLIVNDAANGFVLGADAAQILAAEGFANDAQVALNDAQAAFNAGALARDAAQNYQVQAAAAAMAAESALESVPFSETTKITYGDSPFAVTQAHAGHFLSVDTSAGAVVLNVDPSLTEPFFIRVKKETADGNGVSLVLGGTEKFSDGVTTKQLASIGGLDLTLDTDASPDCWHFAKFGGGAGEDKHQVFVSGIDYNAGDSTLTITEAPRPKSSVALRLFMDAAIQHPNTYTYDPDTGVITFSGGIPVDVGQIYCFWQSASLPVGVTSDGSVSWGKLASGLIASVADIVDGTANKLVDASTLKAWFDNQPKSQDFESAEMVIGGGDQHYQAPHGLGSVPKFWQVSFRCVEADMHYAAGDEVLIGAENDMGNASWTSSTYVNANTIGFVQNGTPIITGGTGVNTAAAPTLSKWRLILRAQS